MSQQLSSGAPPLKPLIEVRNLKKYFPIHKGLFSRHVGDVKAVDDVSFDIYPQETLGVVGESGCGKTTAGRTLLRLLEPTAGTATFDGKDLFGLGKSQLRAMRRHMQIIFQDPYSSLNPRQTVGSIIGDALQLHGLASGDDRFERAKELLERVGLQASYINRYPHEFSGGQRQRIGIARAVALKPKFIVCDEAVSALDVSVQAQILNLLMDLQEEFHLSYMFIAHDLSVVRHISDRVAVMYLGRIVELSVCDDLYDAPLHPYTQALLSAIPHPVPGRRTDRVILEGDVPNPIAPPSGCHFHPRCPLAFDRCRTEAPRMLDARPGHKVRCHLYEDAGDMAEPIPIGNPDASPKAAEAAAARARQAAEAADAAAAEEAPTAAAPPAAPDDVPEAPPTPDDSSEFSLFEGSVDGDGDRPVGIPEVLSEREGMALGPFGEVIDPEDSFVKTAEIPSLDKLVNETTVSIADEPAPTDAAGLSVDITGAGAESGDEDAGADASADDEDETATNLEVPALKADAEGDAEAATDETPALEDEETVLGAAADRLETTLEIPTEPDLDPEALGLQPDADMEDTVDAPVPVEVEVEDAPTVQAPPPSLEPEPTGVMPPIHDEDDVPDDVSLQEMDEVPVVEETAEIPTIPPDDDAPKKD